MHHHVVRLSVCNAVHHGSQSWCTGLKVVSCKPEDTHYIILS